MESSSTTVLERHDETLIASDAEKTHRLRFLQDLLFRGSLAKAAAISSFLVVIGLVTLVRVAAWLLPSKIHLTLPPTFATFFILSVVGLIFSFPVMWAVRVFYRDDIAELERRVAERTAQLRAANKELEAFSYSVSHDLRAPLRHIDGFSRMLAASLGPAPSAETLQSLERIQNASKRMGALIDDLLTMAKIGRQELVRKTVDIKTLAHTVIRDLQMECDGREIRWELGDLPKLHCDEGLLKLVFTNLLSNAVKYTRRVQPAVIEIGQMHQNGACIIFVRDNGAGFDERYVHKLFGPFQRLHRPDEFEGTGVGLATVQRIIEKHGGRIWAEGK